MKHVNEIKAFQVESEPGDVTHYSYIAIQTGPDEVCFAPYRSTFPFPQRLDRWCATDEELRDKYPSEDIVNKANKIGVNPYTYLECARTCIEVLRGDWE